MPSSLITDTIAALATPPGVGGVAVVRISGPNARLMGASVFPKLVNTAPRTMVWGHVMDGTEAIDDALAVWFQGPHSFTGEDVVEIHGHGGRAVTEAVLDAVLAQSGVRMAQPGEFTRRAVENGKMDLTAAEGLADLIDAQTEAQRRQALRQLGGALGERFESWRRRVLELLAQVEAGIDFPDEELDVLQNPALAKGFQELLANWDAALAEEAGRKVRDGLSLAILGVPNAGKSTLINALSGREVAIVSAQAGTTRDVVRQQLNLGGYAVELADTAGLREGTTDLIEQEGIRRARKQAHSADIVLWVADARTLYTKGGLFSKAQPPALAEPPAPDLLAPGRSLIVLSHADTVTHDLPKTLELHGETYPAVALNLTDPGAGKRLQAALLPLLQAQTGTAEEAAWLTRERHRSAVATAARHVGEALKLCLKPPSEGSTSELVAQELRDAAHAIGTVTGRTTSEDVLDVVFSTFCIGK